MKSDTRFGEKVENQDVGVMSMSPAEARDRLSLRDAPVTVAPLFLRFT